MPRLSIPSVTEFILFSLAAALAIIGFESPPDADRAYQLPHRIEEQLRVMTWNVGRKGTPQGQPLAAADIPHVAETIRSIAPDLLFLQEIEDAAQFDQLLAQLGDPWQGALVSSQGRRIAMLRPRGDWRVPRKWRGGRDGSSPMIYIKEGHIPIAAIGVHADAFSAKRRNTQIGEAVAELLRVPNVKARILVGDLNLDLDLDKRRDLFSNDDHLDVETYNYVCKHLFDAGVGTGSTADPDRRLDYIFVDAHLAVVGAGPIREKRVGDMDHDPVVADLILSDR